MSDLSTEYLGLKLASPLVPSSSPLTGELDSARRLEDAGASALVLPSLFEEAIASEQQLQHQYTHSQATGDPTAYPSATENRTGELDNYLEHIRQLKSSLDIPVIASINGITDSGWVDIESKMASGDRLRLDFYCDGGGASAGLGTASAL